MAGGAASRYVPAMRLRAALLALAAAVFAGCTSPQPCPSLLQECSGSCVDVESDRANCGRCGAACGAGEVCLSGACTGDPTVACRIRTGGAYVTLGVCDAAVKLWIESPEFISSSAGRVGQAAPGVPVLGLRAGTDCDAQWSWNANPASARYDPAAPATACDVCPTAIEASVLTYVNAVRLWCPTSATVLAVDVRP